MLYGSKKEIVLQVLNILLIIGAALLTARGFVANDGLSGLGVALLMTSLICFVGFRFGIEQQFRVRHKMSPVEEQGERASTPSNKAS